MWRRSSPPSSTEITAALARGERVELRGFGAFTVKRRDARTGRNPRTGEAVPVDEKAVPFFKAGKELRERVNRRSEASPPPCDPSGRGLMLDVLIALPPADPGAVRAVEPAGGALRVVADRFLDPDAVVGGGAGGGGGGVPARRDGVVGIGSHGGSGAAPAGAPSSRVRALEAAERWR